MATNTSIFTNIISHIKMVPAELVQLVETVVHDVIAQIGPIIAAELPAFEADLAQNAGNPAALLSTALAIGVSAIPKIEAAGITATGLDVLAAVSGAIAIHPAVVSAQSTSAPAPAATAA